MSLRGTQIYWGWNGDASSSDTVSNAKEGHDLVNERKTYAYQSHCLAIGLLRRCGFQCI